MKPTYSQEINLGSVECLQILHEFPCDVKKNFDRTSILPFIRNDICIYTDLITPI